MHDEAAWSAIAEGDRVSARGIEVGHIFHFGDKYSKPMGAKVTGPDGKDHNVSMGSYGIGPTRLIAAIIEASHDESRHHLAGIGRALRRRPDQHEGRRCRLRPHLRRALCRAVGCRQGRALRRHRPAAGGKFATADLIGLPWQVIIGPRGAAAGEAEIKNRKTGERETLPIAAVVARLRLPRHERCRRSEARRRGAVLGLRAARRLALPALAAQGDGDLGDRFDLLPRHHARRRDPHRRHGGDERLSRRASRPASSASTAIWSCSRSTCRSRTMKRSPSASTASPA